VTRERLTWGVPGAALADLGLDSSAPLFSGGAELGPRREVLEDSPARLRVRFALPGTPDARGNLSAKPRALGTGFLWLTIPRGSTRELLRARFTAPRSLSLAEREWNLLCVLRAAGVGTCEPLLVGALGAGLVSARSFLLVRAPAVAFPLSRWLRTDALGAERERGLAALGLFLGRLGRAGVRLAGLSAADLWITPSGSGECETHGPESGLRKNKLPGVTLVEPRGARRDAVPTDCTRLFAELAPELSLTEIGRLIAASLRA